MENRYLDHPSDETLERFLLRRHDGTELEHVDTHILVCDSCQDRLHALDIEWAGAKLAFKEWNHEATRETGNREASRWSWFAFPRLVVACGLTVLALVLVVAPQSRKRTLPMAEVELSAYRGTATASVPQGHPLHLRLNAAGIAEGTTVASLVDETGNELWKGAVAIHQDAADVSLPPISKTGVHYLRIYGESGAGDSGAAPGDLLREFVFQVR
jgi:hypothetical protein